MCSVNITSEIQEYTEFIRSIELINIDLLELNSIKYNQKQENEETRLKEITVNVKSDFMGYEIENNNLSCFPTFIIESKQNNNTIFSIKIKYSVIYTIEGNEYINDTIIKKFLEKNLPINIWPYVRELVSSITIKMGYPTLVLPVYKV